MNLNRHASRSSRQGFTLVEIMVVVIIIGLLLSMAISTFLHSRRQSIATRVANDLRILGDTFVAYSMETGAWPDDSTPGVIPAGMDGYLPSTFTERTAAGGNFDWDKNVFGVVAAISVFGYSVEDEVLLRVDEILDDGNLATGRCRTRTAGYMLVLEE